ncbi:uncharacterized protein VTP21DRAFT_1761 [Calcarisporiella thermophila]|uniref:uncharacterized protein n=1 Tax=Calcarisporiella thermophila TaxID=911321 RepID=UPI0037443A1B
MMATTDNALLDSADSGVDIQSLAEKEPATESKLKMVLSLLTKFIGVKDMAAMQVSMAFLGDLCFQLILVSFDSRLSLPTQLLEPIPNLEYWNYNDRPDYLACINEPDDSVERFLAAIRWWFSKDLKFVKGNVVKAYNSILGEQFHCSWAVNYPSFSPTGNPVYQDHSLNSGQEPPSDSKRAVIHCLIEQTSHHPPVSNFCYWCEDNSVLAYGVDQISARFTGTAVKISAGEQNKGIYVRLPKRDDEEYHMTHPVASIHGWMKGSLYITVSEACVVTCPKTGLKAVLEYKEERWFNKPKFQVEGVVFRYDPTNESDLAINRIKQIPKSQQIICRLKGSWRGEIWVEFEEKEKRLLIDMEALQVVPKTVRPISELGPWESRRVWKDVTNNILAKDFSKATKAKIEIEERQRARAAARKEQGVEHVPYFFHLPVRDGRPELTPAGKEVLFGKNVEILKNWETAP